MIFSRHFIAFLCLGLLPACLLKAADDDEAIRRPSVGLRFTWLTTRMFDTTTVLYSTTKPVAYYSVSGAQSFARFLVSPTVEYRLKPKLSVGAEFRFHHAKFAETSTMKSGIQDPNSNTDDRKTTTIQSTSKANYWEFPFLARYYGLRKKGWWSPAYVGAGAEWRHIGKVRTGTDSTFADGVTDYSEIPAVPNRANQVGAVAAVGMRLVDDATHIKVHLEFRFIRWQGSTFQSVSYHSAPNQMELGLAFSY